MKGKHISYWVLLVIMVLVPMSSGAAAEKLQIANMRQIIRAGISDFLQRCEEFNLSNEQARGYIVWLAKCKAPVLANTIRNVSGEHSMTEEEAIAYYYDYYAFVKDGDGWRPTAARQQYPLIANSKGTAAYIGSTDPNAACDSAPPIPSGLDWKYSCTASCYKPHTLVRFAEGDVPIADAAAKDAKEVVVVAESATMDSIEFETQPVYSFVKSLRPVWHDMVILETASGGRLEVTDNHPLVDSLGVMREAITFIEGDALVRDDGSLDPLTSVVHERWFGEVHNVYPDALESTLNNIVVAEGYLSGSSWFQNEGYDELNRALFRTAIPDEAVF